MTTRFAAICSVSLGLFGCAANTALVTPAEPIAVVKAPACPDKQPLCRDIAILYLAIDRTDVHKKASVITGYYQRFTVATADLGSIDMELEDSSTVAVYPRLFMANTDCGDPQRKKALSKKIIPCKLSDGKNQMVVIDPAVSTLLPSGHSLRLHIKRGPDATEPTHEIAYALVPVGFWFKDKVNSPWHVKTSSTTSRVFAEPLGVSLPRTPTDTVLIEQ